MHVYFICAFWVYIIVAIDNNGSFTWVLRYKDRDARRVYYVIVYIVTRYASFLAVVKSVRAVCKMGKAANTVAFDSRDCVYRWDELSLRRQPVSSALCKSLMSAKNESSSIDRIETEKVRFNEIDIIRTYELDRLIKVLLRAISQT